MRSITVLQKRANRLQEDIKSLLIDNYRYDEELTARLNIISKVTTLRAELATVQREIRERQAA
jgi:predicted house-cleaning noncanonical NTP pyrophosphatase (MazG superfamily)